MNSGIAGAMASKFFSISLILVTSGSNSGLSLLVESLFICVCLHISTGLREFNGSCSFQLLFAFSSALTGRVCAALMNLPLPSAGILPACCTSLRTCESLYCKFRILIIDFSRKFGIALSNADEMLLFSSVELHFLDLCQRHVLFLQDTIQKIRHF